MAAVNTVQRYNCDACEDEGGWEIFHPSTDGLIGFRKCGECPPRPPVYKALRFWESVWKMGPAELAACPPF